MVPPYPCPLCWEQRLDNLIHRPFSYPQASVSSASPHPHPHAHPHQPFDTVIVAITKNLPKLGWGIQAAREQQEASAGGLQCCSRGRFEGDQVAKLLITMFHACWRNTQLSQGEYPFPKRGAVNEAQSAVHYMLVWAGDCGKFPAEHIVLGALFTVKLSTFKNVTSLYQKQQQENPHVGPSESLLRRNRKREDRGWSMRMSYRNREAASGEEEHRKTVWECSHPAVEMIRLWGLTFCLHLQTRQTFNCSPLTLNISEARNLW